MTSRIGRTVLALSLLTSVAPARLAAQDGATITGVVRNEAGQPLPAVTVFLTAVAMGTPEHIAGRQEVAQFFNGAARAALPVFVDDRPGLAWAHRGETRVAFDFTVVDGLVTRIEFRAEPTVLAGVRRRKSGRPVDRGAPA